MFGLKLNFNYPMKYESLIYNSSEDKDKVNVFVQAQSDMEVHADYNTSGMIIAIKLKEFKLLSFK